jgi:hypothetical protein
LAIRGSKERETPRYSQIVTDFQNKTAEATREIADNFLDSQKEVINSMQSAWLHLQREPAAVAVTATTTTG